MTMSLTYRRGQMSQVLSQVDAGHPLLLKLLSDEIPTEAALNPKKMMWKVHSSLVIWKRK